MWSSAGAFTYVNTVIFKLQDITSDRGVHWDSKDSIVPLIYPDSFSGDLGWLNFKGQWGNKGTTSCWWHFIYPECEIVDGPAGIVRDDVLSAASIRSVGTVHVASNVKRVPPKFRMTGPLSVRSHLPCPRPCWLTSCSTSANASHRIRLLRIIVLHYPPRFGPTRLALRDRRTAVRDIQRNRTTNDLCFFLVCIRATRCRNDPVHARRRRLCRQDYRLRVRRRALRYGD